MRTKHIVKVFSATLALAFLASCSGVKFSPAQNSVATTGSPGGGGSGGTVCNPFGGGGGGTASNGLVANSIHYLGPDQINSSNAPIPTISVFNDLWTKADGIYNINVILNQINTPNVYFTNGFSVGNSAPLTAGPGGATLIQYFGFQLKSNFVLGNLAAGNYQLAVLSDDGSNLTITNGTSNGNFIINNDGTHSMQMGCFNSANPSTPPILSLNANSSLPLEFDYFQGPRVTIGLMLLYRPVPPGNPADVACGTGGSNGGGDEYFFIDHDSNNNPISPSQPTAAYTALLTEQYPWTVVPVTNYVLPASNPVNPCSD